MNLEHLFCPNFDCPARGQTGEGNLVTHSQQEKRCCCTVWRVGHRVEVATFFVMVSTFPG
jgi:hypothetical protein